MARLTGTSWNGCYPYLDYSYSQNVAGNYTDISWSFGMHFGNYYFRTDQRQVHWSAATGSGSQDFGPTGTGPWPEGGTNMEVGYASGTYRIFHNTSGAATANLSFSIYKDYSGALTLSYSGTIGLPTIPRQPSAPGTPSVSGHNDSNPTTATISWTAPTDVGAGLADRQIQVSTSSSFATTLIDSTAVWDTSFGATGLAKNTLYYVRVRASSSAGWGPWSTTASFTTGTTAPGAPSTPWTGAIGYTSIEVNWNPPADNGGTAITSYTVQRATNSGFTTGVVSYTLIAGTNYTITGLTASTAYWVRVKAVNATGTSANSTALATGTTTATAPNAPAAPTFANVLGTSLDVNWVAPGTNGAAITSYDLQRAPDSAGAPGAWSTIQSGISAALTSIQVTGLSYGVTYWFRLVANSSVGSSTGASASVTTGTTTPFAPAAPTIGGITQIAAQVSYVAPDSGGSAITGYDIQRATDAAFTTDVVTTPDAASPLDITGLAPAITYYVRVRAKNANGNGAWSPSTSFLALPSAYVGVAHVGAQIYVRSGTTWVLATTQKWSGSAWV